jgi:hypothetical protein
VRCGIGGIVEGAASPIGASPGGRVYRTTRMSSEDCLKFSRAMTHLGKALSDPKATVELSVDIRLLVLEPESGLGAECHQELRLGPFASRALSRQRRRQAVMPGGGADYRAHTFGNWGSASERAGRPECRPSATGLLVRRATLRPDPPALLAASPQSAGARWK